MKDRKGFSLIELLIVIGIIAIFGGVMLSQFSGSTDSALAASCMNNMRTLCNAVMADATKEEHYPSAGPYKYYKVRADKETGQPWQQGWLGHGKGEQNVSCYRDGSDNGEAQHYAITNGTIWRMMDGRDSAYVCPAHTKYCKNKKKPAPSWSYVMNSYFGWDNGRMAPEVYSGRRRYGEGYLKFMYGSKPEDRRRPPERVLLFAEIPYVDVGAQAPQWETSPSDANDMVLQYKADSDEKAKANKAGEGTTESIGFNHKSGKNYFAHVSFADGHCVRLVMPPDASKDDLMNLTTWLCTGLEYTFNGTRYEKVDQ